MPAHFADRLTDAIRAKKVAACVGLDPLIEHLPASLLSEHGLNGDSRASNFAHSAAALVQFGRAVISTIAPYVPVLKINIAFFERYHAEGIRAYGQLVRDAQDAGLLVIGDVKRADIGHSTKQYAHAHLDENSVGKATDISIPDAVTVNPYFGYDAIGPFVELAGEQGRGLFVLVQTSNKSAEQVQGLRLSDGDCVCERVAGIVEGWASDDRLIGSCGYSLIGAVVSPRDLESTRRIRGLMPHSIFLVPGFGAQGRTASEVSHCFKPDGTGAIITASRSVIYAYEDERYRAKYGDDWQRAVGHACKDLVDAIKSVTPS